jgi:hypothetical protein
MNAKGVTTMEQQVTYTQHATQQGKFTQHLLQAGVIGPIFFVLVFISDGFLHPNYSQMSQMVSFLSVQTNGWIQIANFVISGLLLIAFAIGFFQRMQPVIQKRHLLGISMLLFLVGAGLVNDGFNVTALPGQPLGLHGSLHVLGFLVIFASLIAASFLTGRQLLKVPAWRGYGWYSIIAGLITLLSFFALIVIMVKLPAIAGLINRAVIIEAFSWCVIMGYILLTKRASSSQTLQD